MWEKIKPETAKWSDGLLCPSCVMRRIVERGIWTAAHAQDIDEIKKIELTQSKQPEITDDMKSAAYNAQPQRLCGPNRMGLSYGECVAILKAGWDARAKE